MRSLLLVDATSASAFDHALGSGADALIVNLDATRAEIPPGSRTLVRDFLRAAQLEAHRPLLYVRFGCVEDDAIDDDLAAVMLGEPDGILLGCSRSGADVQHLAAKLAVHEAEYGLTEGETGVIAETGAAAHAIFAMASYREASDRLLGLAWDPEAFAADLGSEHHRNPEGSYIGPVTVARSLTLIAARAAAVAAIDGASADLDEAAFEAECRTARRDGFNAKIAVSPEQVAIINAVFDRAA